MKFLSSRLIKMVLVFVSLWMLCLGTVQAYSPEYITHATKGRVKFTQAQFYVDLITKYSDLNGLDSALVYRLIRVESGYNTRALSRRNAKGLMQIVPKWHQDKLQNRDPYDPEINIEVGTAILKEFIDREGSVKRGLQAYEGNRRSSKYVRMVTAVRLTQYDAPYPGSDDRLDPLIAQNPEFAAVAAKLTNPSLTPIDRMRIKYRLDEKRFCIVTEQGITTCELPPTYPVDNMALNNANQDYSSH